MAVEKIVGIVTRLQDFNSTDQIATLITDTEKVSFIAMGVRKITSKNRMSLQLGNIVEVEIFRSRLKGKLSKLKRSTIVKQANINISDVADVLMTITKFLNFVETPDEELFRSILESYDYLNVDYSHHVKTYILFHTLNSRGVKPETRMCVSCNRTDRLAGFDLSLGGFYCALHTEHKYNQSLLEPYYFLGKSFDLYKNVDPFINKILYKEIMQYTIEFT